MSDTVTEFLQGTFNARLALVAAAAHRDALRAHLGERAFAAYSHFAESVLSTPKRRHLGGGLRPSVVFVPGVMGSLICSHGLGGVWWLDVPRLLPRIKDLRLSPDGLQDIDSSFRLAPCAMDHIYAPFLSALGRREDFSWVPFLYDWRKSLYGSADGLRDLIISEYSRSQNQRVSLIAHSMGGLMVRTALMKHGDELWPKINRMVFIGSPHYGSPAIAGYLKDHFWGFNLLRLLGRFLDRKTLWSMRGIVSLLPAPTGVYPFTREGSPESREHPCADFDLHCADSYDISLPNAERTCMQAALDAAREFSVALHQWHFGLSHQHRSRMAVIAGVGKKTLFRVEVRGNGPLGSTRRIISRIQGDPHRDGDGRVPIASAQLEGVGATHYIRGEHQELPMIPAVYNGALDWLKGNTVKLSATPIGALQKHLGAANLPEAPELLPPYEEDPDDPESPGYLQEAVDQTNLDDLQQQLETNRMPEFHRVKIL